MPRRIPRPAALAPALVVALLVPTLAACGSGDGDSASSRPSSTLSSGESSASSAASSATSSAGAASGLEAVTFEGDVGTSLKSTWHSAVKATSAPEVTTLVKGSGVAVADGDTVSAYLYLGDATTQKDAFSDYTNGAPESIPVDSKLSALFTALLSGATYGSRVAAVTPASSIFGASGNTQLGVGAGDSLVVVADLVEKAAVSPSPTDDAVHDAKPADLPAVVADGGTPTGLDFSGISEPSTSTPVQRVILKQGTGAAVKASDTLTVDYLGETYGAKSPFDQSYGKTPLTSQLSGLIQGWSIGLTGVKVGSRVLLQIPPAYGYGAAGSGSTIPANATLWFVIDVEKSASS